MNYLITLTSDCDGVKENYIDTVKNVGKSAEVIMVAFSPYPKTTKKITRIDIDSTYPNNLRRFDYFPTGFEDDDMIIFTDASDVIFQCKIPKLEQIIYASCEYDTWGAPNWWKSALDMFHFDDLNGFPIYCMGTWAMPYKEVKSLLEFMDKNKHRFISSSFSDQILFNWWLKDKNFINKTDLFGSLYAGYDQKKIIKTKDGFIDKDKKLIAIVHANGNKKDLLINKKV